MANENETNGMHEVVDLKSLKPKNRPLLRVRHTRMSMLDDSGHISRSGRSQALADAITQLSEGAILARRMGGIGTGGSPTPQAYVLKGTSAGLGQEQDSIGWVALGPYDIGGRTRAIVFDPNNVNTVWAASVAGGVWRSDNGGKLWVPSQGFMGTTTNQIGNLAVVSLVRDPATGTLFCGTGEGFFNIDSIPGDGMFRSTDGWSWEGLKNTRVNDTNTDFEYVNGLAVTTIGSVLLAATRSGLRRSEDGLGDSDDPGTNWVRVQAGDFGNVVFNPGYVPKVNQADETVPRASETDAIASTLDGQLYFSIDGGRSWQNATFNGGTPTANARAQICYSKQKTSTVYACIAPYAFGSANQYDSGIWAEFWASSDGGRTFTKKQVKDGTGQPVDLGGGQGWYDLFVWAGDDSDDKLVVVAGVHLYRSLDGGDTFEQIDNAYMFAPFTANPVPVGVAEIHPDNHVIVSMPGNDLSVLVGNDGGVYQTTNLKTITPTQAPANGGWTNRNTGFAVTQFYYADGARDGNTPIVVAGAQDNGTRSLTGGNFLWDEEEVNGGDGGAVSALNADNWYVEYINLKMSRAVRTQTANPDGSKRSTWTQEAIWGSYPGWVLGSPYRIPDAYAGTAPFISPFLLDPKSTSNTSAGYSLRVMSVGSAVSLPAAGNRLVVVALVGGKAHVRIFDRSGNMAIDKSEAQLVNGNELNNIHDLLKTSPFPIDSELSPEEKRKTINDAASTSSYAFVVMYAGGVKLWRSTNIDTQIDVDLASGSPVVNSYPKWYDTGYLPPNTLPRRNPCTISAIAIGNTPANGNAQQSDLVLIGNSYGQIWRTTDGNKADAQVGASTWNRADTGINASRACLCVAVDPGDATGQTYYAAFGGFVSGNIWKTTNGGGLWTNLNPVVKSQSGKPVLDDDGNEVTLLPKVPIRCITFHPDYSNWVYLATEVGVYASEDGGKSWSAANSGPAAVRCDDFFWMDRALTVVTHGRGLFQIDLTPRTKAKAILAGDLSGNVYAVDATTGETAKSNSLAIGSGVIGELLVVQNSAGLRHSAGTVLADFLKDKAFFGDDSGNVQCIDVAKLMNGDDIGNVRQWRVSVPGPIHAQPLLWVHPSEKRIYLLVITNTGELHFLDPSDGSHKSTLQVFSSAPGGGTVWGIRENDDWCYLTSDTGVFAVNLLESREVGGQVEQGALGWAKPGLQSRFAPLVTVKAIYISGNDGKLHALEARSGDAVWKSDKGAVGGTIGTQPVWVLGSIAVGTQSGTVVGLDHRDGERHYSISLGSNTIESLTADDNVLYFVQSGPTGKVCKYGIMPSQSDWTATKLSETPLLMGSGSKPLVVGDKLYVINTPLNMLYCYNTSDLSLAWADPYSFQAMSMTALTAVYEPVAAAVDAVTTAISGQAHDKGGEPLPSSPEAIERENPPRGSSASDVLLSQLQSLQIEAGTESVEPHDSRPALIQQVARFVENPEVQQAVVRVLDAFLPPASTAGSEPVAGLAAQGLTASQSQAGTAANIRTKAKAINLSLALDLSGSMNNAGQVGNLQADAATFINAMRNGVNNEPKDSLAVVSFETTANVRWSQAGKVKQLADQTTKLTAVTTVASPSFPPNYNTGDTKWTNMDAALRNCSTTLEGATGPKAIVFMTDGIPEVPNVEQDPLETAKETGVPVYTLGLGNGVNETLLGNMASQTSGRFLLSPTIQQLPVFFNKILGDVGIATPVTNSTFDIPGYKPFVVSGWLSPTATTATVAVTWHENFSFTNTLPPKATEAYVYLQYGVPARNVDSSQITELNHGSIPGGGTYVVYRISNPNSLPSGTLPGPFSAVVITGGNNVQMLKAAIGVLDGNPPAKPSTATTNQMVRAGQSLNLATVAHHNGTAMPIQNIQLTLQEPTKTFQQVVEANQVQISNLQRRSETAGAPISVNQAVLQLEQNAPSTAPVLHRQKMLVTPQHQGSNLYTIEKTVVTPGIHVAEIVMTLVDPDTGRLFQLTDHETYFVY